MAGIPGVSDAGVKIVIIIGILIGYTVLWRISGIAFVRWFVRIWGKTAKHDEATIKRLQTYGDHIAVFAFFVSYIPLAIGLVRWFDLLNNDFIQGGKWIAGTGLVMAYVFQSHFMSLSLGGIKFLLLKPGKVGDHIDTKSIEWGKKVDEGWIASIDTHGSKNVHEDGTFTTLNNEKLSGAVSIKNHDSGIFHHKVFKIPVGPGQVHSQLADQITLAISSLQSENIYKTTTPDEEWYDRTIGKLTKMMTGTEAGQITARFRIGYVHLFVPVKTHSNALKLEHEILEKFPEIFGHQKVVEMIA